MNGSFTQTVQAVTSPATLGAETPVSLFDIAMRTYESLVAAHGALDALIGAAPETDKRSVDGLIGRLLAVDDLARNLVPRLSYLVERLGTNL